MWFAASGSQLPKRAAGCAAQCRHARATAAGPVLQQGIAGEKLGPDPPCPHLLPTPVPGFLQRKVVLLAAGLGQWNGSPTVEKATAPPATLSAATSGQGQPDGSSCSDGRECTSSACVNGKCHNMGRAARSATGAMSAFHQGLPVLMGPAAPLIQAAEMGARGLGDLGDLGDLGRAGAGDAASNTNTLNEGDGDQSPRAPAGHPPAHNDGQDVPAAHPHTHTRKRTRTRTRRASASSLSSSDGTVLAVVADEFAPDFHGGTNTGLKSISGIFCVVDEESGCVSTPSFPDNNVNPLWVDDGNGASVWGEPAGCESLCRVPTWRTARAIIIASCALQPARGQGEYTIAVTST